MIDIDFNLINDVYTNFKIVIFHSNKTGIYKELMQSNHFTINSNSIRVAHIKNLDYNTDHMLIYLISKNMIFEYKCYNIDIIGDNSFYYYNLRKSKIDVPLNFRNNYNYIIIKDKKKLYPSIHINGNNFFPKKALRIEEYEHSTHISKQKYNKILYNECCDCIIL